MFDGTFITRRPCERAINFTTASCSQLREFCVTTVHRELPSTVCHARLYNAARTTSLPAASSFPSLHPLMNPPELFGLLKWRIKLPFPCRTFVSIFLTMNVVTPEFVTMSHIRGANYILNVRVDRS